MAGNIKGITIEIGGETTGLQKSLSGVNKQSKDLQSELKQVDKLLKFNPGNTELVAQKQKLLADQVTTTSQKLKQLKEAQTQVDTQFAKGQINGEQYRAFQREIVATQGQLDGLKGKLSSIKIEQERAADSTKQLNNLFAATGTNIDEYASTLGTKLVNAIKNGTATSKQLDDAISKVGQEALGAGTDLDKMKQAISQAGDGASLKSIKKELSSLSNEADNAKDSVKSMGSELAGVVGGIAAGGGIAGVVSKALDTSSLNTKIDISFDVPPESVQSVKNAISTVTTYGVDAEAALEGVRRQWALNKNASDETNAAVVQGAATIAASYSGIDFNELIQETNEISKALKISDEEAIGLTNSLLKAGFPPEQIDIIAEYGTQLSTAGYNAQEIQAIMAAGVETGTWNIDNLLDGLKEGRIKLAEFGQEVPKATAGLLAGTDISTKQLQQWGQAVAKGGEGGKQAMQEVAQALMNVKDETQRNALGTQFFGTMWEDQGTNITDTLLNMNNHLSTAKQNQDSLNQSTEQLNSDPAIAMQQAFSDMQTALSPLLTSIAELVTKMAEWVSNNPTLASTIAAVASAIGIIVGAAMVLAPIFTAISAAAGALGIGIGALLGPIAIAIAAIIALVAAGVAIYKNWGSISDFFVNLWEGVKNAFSTAITAIIDFVKNNWQTILTVITGPIGILVSLIVSNWDTIKSATSAAWNGIKTFLSTLWNGIKTTASTVWNALKTGITTVWNGIKSGISTAVNNIKSTVSNVFNSIKSTATNVWSSIKTAMLNPIETAKNAIKTAIDKIKGFFSGLNLKFPKITMPPLPHFSLDGKFSLNPPSIPKLSVDWYAKGGILTKPTLFGASGGSLMGGGEAGAEGVIPLNKETLGAIGAGIAQTMGTKQPITVNLTLGTNNFSAFVKDINDVQQIQLMRNNRMGGVL